ncbi:zinc finger, CCHC-type containing protein [Tanacetum coccineum]|uniref:Zinc finger, CCHC-type containing protein n=1 Tax=Tanacetum coccineum TaxID=301880 RepID=A0ABQ4X5R2_9ASTR
MGDENPIHTLGDYSKPSHEGYRNTIKLSVGNNVVPLRSDTIRLVQNGCSFHGLRSEDPNQHLKDFLKLVDSLDLDGENRERMRLRLFQFSLCDQASNWLERLPAGSITTWEDLTTRFLAQFFPLGRTANLRNDILMFQQHHGESLSEAWTRFKDLLQKVPHYGIDLWLQVQIFYDHVNPVIRRTIDQSAGGKLRNRNAKESWALLEDLFLYDNEMNKITTSCEICSGPHDTQYYMEDPEQALVEYASSRIDKAGGLVSNFMASQDPRLSQVVLGKPFVEISNMTHDPPEGVVRFTNGNSEFAYKMPHKIEQYELLSDLEKEHTKSVYLRNEEDKRRGVEYVMSKILGFYKECLELGPEYLTRMDDEREVTNKLMESSAGNFSSKTKISFSQNVETASRFTRDAITRTPVTGLYLMRRSLEVLRKFHWTILG